MYYNKTDGGGSDSRSVVFTWPARVRPCIIVLMCIIIIDILSSISTSIIIIIKY